LGKYHLPGIDPGLKSGRNNLVSNRYLDNPHHETDMTRDTQEIEWRLKVFDSLSFPTRILRPDGTIIAVNDVFLKVNNDISENIVGCTCQEVNRRHFPHQSFPCLDGQECPLRRAVETKVGQSVLLHTFEEDGTEHWEDRVFSPIICNDGQVKYVVESIRDVTNVKVLEKMYSDMRELIDKVVQSSVSGIIAANRKGDIILANKAAEELFGYDASEVRKVHIENFYPDGVARDIMKRLRDEGIGGKGKLPITRVDIVNKSGQRVPVEMTAAIIYEGGEEVASAGIFNDLREKLAVEKKLQETQAKIGQTEKMASLGRLAAGVAHEINNPLTSILMYGNMMREKLEADHPLHRNLDFVLEDAERCKEIVKNLLAYSRQSSPAREVFPINNLVQESLRLIHDQRLFMNVQVIKNLANQEVFVRADKNQICQVVINLIMNAVDAMEERGVLTLTTRLGSGGGNAVLEVSDTGNGIPVEHLSRIFDPFFTTKALGKGTGLGLSLAYGVMEENQGRIFVKETGLNGTTITLELPVVILSNEIFFESIG